MDEYYYLKAGQQLTIQKSDGGKIVVEAEQNHSDSSGAGLVFWGCVVGSILSACGISAFN